MQIHAQAKDLVRDTSWISSECGENVEHLNKGLL
jgi:hypothetical protein